MGPRHPDRIHIGGAWIPSAATGAISVIDPSTERVIAEIPAGDPADVERAVAAAQAAGDAWERRSPADRAALVARIGEGIERRAEEFADVISADLGTPRGVVTTSQVRTALADVASYLAAADGYPWEEPVGNAIVRRVPVGVVATITPWNFPLSMLTDKIVPALLAGCTVIAKPSEIAPLSAWMLAEVAEEAGLPAGVLNLVSGTGPTVGEALVGHRGVDLVSFTGSTRAGKRIAARAAENSTRVVLEMGGKSANIILDDADLDLAIPDSVRACFSNSGQVCIALSRMLVPRGRYDEVVERVRDTAASYTVGPPGEPVRLGPLVSEAQRERVRSSIARGVEEGARVVTGGAEPPDGLHHGYFVRPTVFADVDNAMSIAREEIFGPVLVLIPYDGEDDAVRIANDSDYGLSGSVWSTDAARATAVARRLRTGSVRLNGVSPDRSAPFGGFKDSGIGRTRGRFGLDHYVELQAISDLRGARA